jgi:hypothetical protein
MKKMNEKQYGRPLAAAACSGRLLISATTFKKSHVKLAGLHLSASPTKVKRPKNKSGKRTRL